MSKQTVHFFCREPELVRCFRTRICLHGHELYSQECLSFLPRYPHQVAGISHSSSSDTRSQMGPSHVRSCPPIPGPDHWTESCFYRGEDGIARPLSLLWTGCVPGMPDGGADVAGNRHHWSEPHIALLRREWGRVAPVNSLSDIRRSEFTRLCVSF